MNYEALAKKQGVSGRTGKEWGCRKMVNTPLMIYTDFAKVFQSPNAGVLIT